MLTFVLAVLATAASPTPAPLDDVPETRLHEELRCLLGVYALPAGRTVTITGNSGRSRGLQYTFSDGQFGSLKETARGSYAAGSLKIDFAPCSAGSLKLVRGKSVERGVHLRLIEKHTNFASGGTTLHGKLVLPPNGRARYGAVWIEGSNNNPSTDDTVWQYELARRGIAVFVYDKRGTGGSGGALSSDFDVRARDTAEAVREARRLAPAIAHFGVVGGSQGGWVAPLTATLVPLDFVVPAFAMAESPIAQDKELVELQVQRAGFDGAAMDAARELTSITERIVRSNMGDGFADLDAFKTKHAGAPWLAAIQPRSYTGLFLRFSTDQIKSVGPAMAQGLSFGFEPRPVIEAIKPRQLWLLGGSDQQAPNLNTQTILRQIQAKRSDVAVVVFPDADHGLIETIPGADGEAMTYSKGLFDVAADWIKGGKLAGNGNFIVMPKAGGKGH